MEAVGIALGAAPLAIQALDGVRKGFEIFEEAALADRQFQHFKICLHMEYARISEWSVMTGLLHAEGDKTQALRYDRQLKHNGSLVVAALTQIQMLLRDLRRTELTYDYLIEESPLASPTSDSHQPVPKKSRDIAQPDAGVVVGEILAGEDIVPDRRQNFIKRTWRAAKKPMKDHKRFWWAIRDTKKFEKSLVQIAELIDFLQEMLTKDQMTKVLESTNNLNLMMLQLANDITEVKAVLWAGDARRPATLASSGDGLDGQTLVGDVDERDSAHFWREAARFSIDIAEESATFASSRRLAQEDVEAIRYGVDFDGGARTMATMARGQDVWVEWRSFTVESAFNRAPRKEDIERVERLVSLLYISRKPVQFCVPRCLGYFQDGQSTRFGLVFEPPRDEGHSQPISLRACFEHRQANLKTKICLAQQLTQWLMYLHVVNWMHKGLRSAIVLFFLKGEVPEDLGKPFVTGFEYSRIANQDTTLGPTADDIQRAFYVHPDYLGYKRQFGFLKTYDIYSLGVILIEIAYWQPISGIYRLTKPTTQDDAEDELEPAISDIIKFREQTLNGENGILHHISMVMGDSFHAATKACLQGMSGLGLHQQAEPAEGQVDEQADVRALEQAVEQGDVEVAADIQQGFIDQVIDVLKQISV